MTRPATRFAPTWLALWLCACTPPIEPIVACDARGPAKPLCGYQNPEDLVALPGGQALLVSEYGGMDRGRPGALSRLDLASEERTVIFRAAPADAPSRWGDPACAPPQAFSPHGIDLVRRDDGRLALFVVNHAGRESVEMFEVLDASGAARVAWRGCAVAPEGAWLNDVEGTARGDFLVSDMMPRRGAVGQVWEFAKAALLGVESGRVLRWSPAGFEVVAGSATVFPNGIALSADGSSLYIDSTLGNRVRGIDLASGRVLGEAAIPSPDNSTWGADGRLWVASLTAGTLELQACRDLERGNCPGSFAIIALDPKSFETEVVYASDGVTMGAGTVGLNLGTELFIGTFAGDRILRVALAGR